MCPGIIIHPQSCLGCCYPHCPASEATSCIWLAWGQQRDKFLSEPEFALHLQSFTAHSHLAPKRSFPNKAPVGERLDGSSVWHSASKSFTGRLPYCRALRRRPRGADPTASRDEFSSKPISRKAFNLPAPIRTSFPGGCREGSSQLLHPAFDATKRSLILLFMFERFGIFASLS